MNKVFLKMAEKTSTDYGIKIEITSQGEQNKKALLRRLKEREGILCFTDFFGCALPAEFPRETAHHAQSIFEQTYLQPFTVSAGRQLPIPPKTLRRNQIQRTTHGAMHAARVSAWTLVMANLYRKHGDQDALKLTNEDILLIQIAALFHDAARQDEGVDRWDSQSGELCYRYFIKNGIDEERARIFSDAARHKDTLEIKSIAHKLIHDADALDIMRLVPQFRLEELDFYNDIAQDNPEAFSDLAKTAVTIRSIISLQADLQHPERKPMACITVTEDESTLIEQGEAVPDTFDIVKKMQYEHAPNCYTAVAQDISHHPFLSSLYVPIEEQAKKPEPSSTQRLVNHHSLGTSQLTPKSILSQDEKKLLSHFLDMDFYLHHTTNTQALDAILNTPSPALRGLAERNRWGEVAQADHTGDLAGLKNNIFMGVSIGMSHFSNPAFIDYDDIATVFIHIKQLLKHAPHALNGLWASGHFGYYINEIDITRSGETSLLGGAEFSWRHSTILQHPRTFSKEILCKDKKGIRLQRFNISDEIYTEENVWLSFGLRFIEQLRLLGEDNPLRQHLLAHPDDKRMMAATLEELFRVDSFEMKLPTSLSLNHPGVSLIYSQSFASNTAKYSFIKNKLPHVQLLSRSDIATALGEAAALGKIQALKTLIDQGHPLEGHFYSKTGKAYPLVKAIEHNQLNTVRWLIEQGANQKCFDHRLIGAKISTGDSELNFEMIQLFVAASQIPGMMETLQRHGFNTNHLIINDFVLAEAQKKNIPLLDVLTTDAKRYVKNFKISNHYLIQAVKRGHLEVVRKLVTLISLETLQSTDEYGFNAMHYAVWNEQLDIISYLAAYHPLLANLVHPKGRSPLFLAVGINKLDTVKKLIACNANPRLQRPNAFGFTPLHYAAQEGFIDIVTYFIELDPTLLTIADNKGRLPLHVAICSRQPTVVSRMLELNADVSVKTRDLSGFNALHLATRLNDTNLIVLLIQHAPWLRNSVDSSGYAALHLAAIFERLEALKQLITLNADITQTAKKGKTVLHFAAENENQAISIHIINCQKALLNVTCNQGWSPLHAAVCEGSLNAVKTLLAYQADATLRTNERGLTALHLAIHHEKEEMVDCLVKYDPRLINIIDNKNQSPLQFARMKGNPRLIGALNLPRHVQGSSRNAALSVASPVSCTL